MNRLLSTAAALLAFAPPQMLAWLIIIDSAPKRLAGRMKSDYVKWGKVVKDIGLKVE